MDKDALFLSVNEFSTKVLIGETIFPSPCGGRSGILRVRSSHMKV